MTEKCQERSNFVVDRNLDTVSSTPRLSEIRTHNSYEYEEKKLIHNKKTDKGQA
jgi:hypothetical protein